MKILSIGKELHHDGLSITSIETSSLAEHHDIERYNYIIINGGDGTIRRALKQLHDLKHIPIFILNPTGSFNVVAKIHRAPKIEKVLDALANDETPKTQKHHLFNLSVKTTEFFNETSRGKDKESAFTHEHKWCHNQMYGEKKNN